MNPSAKEFVPSWSAKEFVPKVAAACAPTEVKPAESIPVPKAAEPTSVKRRADLKPEVEENKTAESKSPQDDLEAELAEEIDAVMAAEAAQHDGREHVNMVFIGHVDAGKSTISGQLLIQMGMVDSRVIEKYEREAKEKNRESWYIAYIMDVSEDERVKGKTVETGRAYFVSDKKRYTILDAPGHKSYVPSMISGAAQADIAVLVISARKGEFETGFDRGGQTREHAMLVKTLGVTKLVIAVNKMDDPSVKWSEERFTGIKDKLEPFLKSCGFNTKKNVDFVPIAGLSGINIKDKVPKEVCPWYTGASLVELLDELPPIPRDPEGSVRIPVADKYKAKGYTIAFGKLETGTIKVGQVVVVMPVNQEAEIAMIEINDKSVSVATPGENLCVYLKGIEEANVLPGFVICDAVSPCPTVRSFVGKVVISELLPHKPLISKGYSCVLHIHAAQVECEISDILYQYDKKTGKPAKKNPPYVKSGAIAALRISIDQALCLENFEVRPQLGRFTLRDEGKTIGIGKVVKLDIEGEK